LAILPGWPRSRQARAAACIDHRQPALGRHIEAIQRKLSAGIVDQHIHAAQLVMDIRDKTSCRIRIADRQHPRHHLPPRRRLNQVLCREQLLLTPAADSHVRSQSREQGRGRLAETGAAPRHSDTLAFHHVRSIHRGAAEELHIVQGKLCSGRLVRA
jgi:hypothetical protein